MELLSTKKILQEFNISINSLRYYTKEKYITKVGKSTYCKESIIEYLKSIEVIDFDNEVWKEAKGYSRYLFSNFGRIKSKNYKSGFHERIINPTVTGGYYKTVFLNDKNKYQSINVHRLICLAFYPNEKYLNLEVNHKDGNKLNNNIDNLEWCTRQENIKHCVDNKLQIAFKGEDVGTSLLTEIQVILIRSIAYQRGSRYNRKELANQFKVSPNTIKDVVNRYTWKHI
jgi:hypothetical protein